MSMYYLMAQLPSLDGMGENAPPPITEERFEELCRRFLGRKAQRSLESLTLTPPRDFARSASPLINAWNAGERDLRLALGKARAERMKKTFDAGDADLPAGLLQTARTAAEMEDPMEAEKFLSRYRQDFLESLRPMDMFAEDAVFYYALKLKLLVRASRFDAAAGKAAYRNIYNSILNGDRLEVLS